MSNAYRNEVEIDLNGTKYLLRPTFEALAQIEDEAKSSIWQVLSQIGTGAIGIRLTKFILETGIKAGMRDKADAEFVRNLTEAGLVTATAAITTFLVAATNAGDLAKKN